MVFSSGIRLLIKSLVGLGGFKAGHMKQPAVVSADRLSRMIRQDQERRAKRQQRSSSTKPNKAVKFIESENMKHFNRLLMQNLNLLKSQSALQSIVFTHGLVFTEVSVTPSWNEVYIFWKASNGENVQEQLDVLAPDVRHQLHQLNELGKVPKVIFAQDYQYVRKEKFLNLMASLQEPLEVEKNSTSLLLLDISKHLKK